MPATGLLELDLYLRKSCAVCCAKAQAYLARAVRELQPPPARVTILDVGVEEHRRGAVAAGVVVTPTLLVRPARGRVVAVTMELSDGEALALRLQRETRLAEARPSLAELSVPPMGVA